MVEDLPLAVPARACLFHASRGGSLLRSNDLSDASTSGLLHPAGLGKEASGLCSESLNLGLHSSHCCSLAIQACLLVGHGLFCTCRRGISELGAKLDNLLVSLFTLLLKLLCAQLLFLELRFQDD